MSNKIVEGIPHDSDFYKLGEWNVSEGRALAAHEDLKTIRVMTMINGVWHEHKGETDE
jgi:hypothetical protein